MRIDEKHPGRHVRALTLIETVISLVILGGAFVALLNTAGASRTAHATAAERRYAVVLAEDLMDEILAMPNYKEGDAVGPDVGENRGNRSAFDDVDDYHMYVDYPISEKDGTPIQGVDGLARWSVVYRADPTNPNSGATGDEGLVYIIVTVQRGSKKLAQIYGYRSDVWQPPEEGY